MGDIETRAKELIEEKCMELGIEVEEMEVMPDHVHLYLKAKPIHAPQYIVAQIKGYTARVLRMEFPSLKSRLPSLWTRSYFVESVGSVLEETIKNYIQNQKNK
jgi:putative transposase